MPMVSNTNLLPTSGHRGFARRKRSSASYGPIKYCSSTFYSPWISRKLFSWTQIRSCGLTWKNSSILTCMGHRTATHRWEMITPTWKGSDSGRQGIGKTSCGVCLIILGKHRHPIFEVLLTSSQCVIRHRSCKIPPGKCFDDLVISDSDALHRWLLGWIENDFRTVKAR